jgi:ribosomal protein S18 acetylase RimI-like enzyme
MITIRKARLRDVDEVTELLVEMYKHHEKRDYFFRPRKGARRAWKKYVEHSIRSRKCRVFVADTGEKLAGFVICEIERIEDPYLFRKRGSVYDIFVHPDFRRQGIATMMVKEALKWFRHERLRRVELIVLKNNEYGEGFWRALGFRDFLERLVMRI